jgi:drug/metabolite transporter (DMT)-like permease
VRIGQAGDVADTRRAYQSWTIRRAFAIESASMTLGPSPRRGLLSIACAACLWGTWSVFLRAAERVHPLSAGIEAFIPFAVVFLVIAPHALRERAGNPRRRGRAAWSGIVLLGAVDALNVLFFFWAMQRTSLAIAVLTHYLAPVLVALFAIPLLREPARPRTFVALACALSGLLVLLTPWRDGAQASFTGAALGVASAVFFAANILASKRLSSHFGPSELFAYRVPSALLVLFWFVPSGGFAIAPEAALYLVLGGLVPGAFAGLLFFRALRFVDAGRASVLTLLEPLVAVLVSVIVWNEPLPISGWLGVGLVLAGAYVVLRPSAASTGAVEPDVPSSVARRLTPQ